MKGMWAMVSSIIAALVFAGVAPSAQAQGFGTDTLRISGSASVASRVNLYAKQYMRRNPGKRIVVSGGETLDGFKRFINGDSEVLMMARRMSEEERKEAEKKGMKLAENQVGVGAIVIVVNPSVSVKQLTLKQARDIFTGEVTNWSQVGGEDAPIQVVAIGKTDAPTMDFLRDRLFGGKEIAATAIVRPTFSTLVKKVALTANAVGFARASDIYALRRVGEEGSINIVPLSIREGTQIFYPVTSIEGGHASTYYPLERPYFLYYNRRQKGRLAKNFADFCEKQIITNPGDYLDKKF